MKNDDNQLYTNTLDSSTLKNYSWDLASSQYIIVVQTEVQAGVTKNDKWIDNVYFLLQANHFKYLNLSTTERYYKLNLF